MIVSYSSDTYPRSTLVNKGQEKIYFTDAGRVELALFHVAKIFEQFFPSFTEEPRLVTTTPKLLR